VDEKDFQCDDIFYASTPRKTGNTALREFTDDDIAVRKTICFPNNQFYLQEHCKMQTAFLKILKKRLTYQQR